MVAVCCAMIVPTTAEAQPCIQHTYTKNYVGTNIISAQYSEHEYTVIATVDGVTKEVTRYCNIRLARDHYIEKCMLCGETGKETYEDRQVHMGADCPFKD